MPLTMGVQHVMAIIANNTNALGIVATMNYLRWDLDNISLNMLILSIFSADEGKVKAKLYEYASFGFGSQLRIW